jgi:hypothetical protein
MKLVAFSVTAVIRKPCSEVNRTSRRETIMESSRKTTALERPRTP